MRYARQTSRREGSTLPRRLLSRLQRPRAQRLVQAASLTTFLGLLAAAFANLALPVAENLFLRLDPLVALATAIGARDIPAGIVPGLALLALAPLLGRAFCGWICPMGATVDAADALLARRRRMPAWLPKLKHLLLALVLGAALLGTSLAFVAAPMPLVTRFWGLLAYPLAAEGVEAALPLTRIVGGALDINRLLWLEVKPPVFATMTFVAVFFGLVFAAARLSPRFWCRYVCPAGASLALLSFRPAWRRRVSRKCIECGKCQRACPMKAIPADPHATRHAECILCRSCAGVCPTRAIDFPVNLPRFGRSAPEPGEGAALSRTLTRQGNDFPAPSASRKKKQALSAEESREYTGASIFHVSDGQGSRETGHVPVDQRGIPASNVEPVHPPLVGRRAVLAAGAAGVAGLTVGGLGLASPLRAEAVRPPGSAPEDDFLARCTRCGQCAVACPTNIIQPVWFSSGLLGAFSPALVPVRGFCDPHCHACARACPTRAIRPLPSEERVWSKLGTAKVDRETCLAWKDKKKCLVCDEVCPYGAVSLKPEPGNPVYVPHVDETHCAGCGYCEHFCPVRPGRAILVEPKDQIRLASGSPAQAARAKGLSLSLKQKKEFGYPVGSEDTGLPPGFSPLEESGAPGGGESLPPGFSPLEPDTGASETLPPGFSK